MACLVFFLLIVYMYMHIYLYHILSSNTLAAASKSLQSCPTLCNPIDGSPPGSPVPGILQARTLEWVAISRTILFSQWLEHSPASLQQGAVVNTQLGLQSSQQAVGPTKSPAYVQLSFTHALSLMRSHPLLVLNLPAWCSHAEYSSIDQLIDLYLQLWFLL